MTAELIYRTTSPAALDFWAHAETKASERKTLVDAYIEQLTHDFGTVNGKDRTVWNRGPVVYGVECLYGEQPPADSGWRLDSKEGIWMPKLRIPAGKERARELAALTVYNVRAHVQEIGIPQMVMTDRHFFRPGIEFHDGVLYQTWGSGKCEPDALAEAAKVPEVVWEPVKRSEWYALEEAREAEATTEETTA